MKRLCLIATLVLLFWPHSSKAQTTLLQSLIDATPAGGTLTLPSDAIYRGGAVINKSIRIRSVGVRLVQSKRGDFFVGATVLTPTVEPAITIAPGVDVDGVSIEGVEMSATGWVFDIVRIGTTGSAQNTFEEEPRNVRLHNVWIHGLPTQDSQRGIAANGQNISITNSKVNEVHYRGVDSQAIAIWNGSGPLRIIDCHLEAAGENFLAGGSNPSIPNLVPSNIEFRRNFVFKPLTWKKGDPSFVPVTPPPDAPWLDHWTVKNGLELKNARNVTIDGNVFLNCWPDGQDGTMILLTVRNQGPDFTAPWSTIENVTFTNNTVKGASSALNLLGMDNEAVKAGTFSQRATGLKIINNVFDNKGTFLTMNGYYNVTIGRNTFLQTGNTATLYGEQSLGFVAYDNITIENQYGIFGDGGLIGKAALDKWTPGYSVSGNVLANLTGHEYSLKLAGNINPTTLNLTLDYRAPDWPGKGVEVDALNAAQTGGSAPAPSPSPSPTPSPVPSPTPTPTPNPSPTPTPSPALQSVVVKTFPSGNDATRARQINEYQSKEGVRFVGCSGNVCYFARF